MSRDQEKFNKRRLQSSYLSTVVSVSLVLFMLGLLGLIVLHAKKLSDYVKENIGVSIIIKEETQQQDILKLGENLKGAPYVKSSSYITKEQAAAKLQQDLGEDFLKFLGYNPLLSSYEVRLKAEYANNDSIKILEKTFLQNAIVKEVFYQKSLVELVNENIQKIGLVILGFSTLLMLIAIALINNTIRLSIYSKRFIIKSMQLVGATQGFIRKPFLLNGLLQGLIAAFVAIFLLAGVLYFAQQEIPELVELQDIQLFASLSGMVAALGMFISLISTFFAVRKYLKINTSDLY
jgi:cell division transport system permease protein